MLENPRETVIPLVEMNRHRNQNLRERYSTSKYVFGFMCLVQKLALLCYVLLCEKSKRNIVTYDTLDALKYNTIPNDINRVKRRDI